MFTLIFCLDIARKELSLLANLFHFGTEWFVEGVDANFRQLPEMYTPNQILREIDHDEKLIALQQLRDRAVSGKKITGTNMHCFNHSPCRRLDFTLVPL